MTGKAFQMPSAQLIETIQGLLRSMKNCLYYIERRNACFISVMLLALFYSTCSVITQVPPPPEKDLKKEAVVIPPHVLKYIRVDNMKVDLHLRPYGTGSVNYSAFKFHNPLKLVIDLPNTVAENISYPLTVENEIIGKIETIMLEYKSQPFTRVEIGLNQDASYSIDQGIEEIWVSFYPAKTQDNSSGEEAKSQPAVIEGITSKKPLPSSPVGDKEYQKPASKVLEIQTMTSEEGLDINIVGNGKIVDYDVLILDQPPRLVVDLFGISSTEVKDNSKVKSDIVKRIRVGAHGGKVRIVLDLTHIPQEGVPYQLTSKGNRLVISLKTDTIKPSR